MTQSVVKPVVVGYDGSTGSLHALDWGATEAGRRDLPLQVIHVWEPPPMMASGFGTATMPDSELILDDALAYVDKVAPQVAVTTHAKPGSVAGAFVDASFDADTVVIGAQGHHRATVRDFGSTAWQVAIHAVCPVVVVREVAEVDHPRPIVVGVDGSRHSALALDYAVERAAGQDVELVAVHGWQLDRLDQIYAGMGGTVPEDLFEQGRAAELTEWLRPVVTRYPDVRVRSVSVREQAAAAILQESQTAQLVVIGSHGRGGFRGMLLGSVGMDLLRQATCPVAIVRG